MRAKLSDSDSFRVVESFTGRYQIVVYIKGLVLGNRAEFVAW